jgi:hypothetical protein
VNVFTFVFLVVLVGCSIPLLKLWIDYRQTVRREERGNPGPDVMRQIAALENRVQVLEEIVTDKTYDLRREIAALEAQPSPTAAVLTNGRSVTGP